MSVEFRVRCRVGPNDLGWHDDLMSLPRSQRATLLRAILREAYATGRAQELRATFGMGATHGPQSQLEAAAPEPKTASARSVARKLSASPAPTAAAPISHPAARKPVESRQAVEVISLDAPLPAADEMSAAAPVAAASPVPAPAPTPVAPVSENFRATSAADRMAMKDFFPAV